jgi:hypothetical protein
MTGSAASRRMDATSGLAAILRDARKCALLRMRAEMHSRSLGGRSRRLPASPRTASPPAQAQSCGLDATNHLDGQITSDFQKSCQARKSKIFRFTCRANHHYKLAPSHPMRGAARDRHERAVGCGGRKCGERRTPRPADGEAVWSWRPDAGVKFLRSKILRGDGGKKARSPGRARSKQ